MNEFFQKKCEQCGYVWETEGEDDACPSCDSEWTRVVDSWYQDDE